ncbi:EamA family transporter [Alkalihalobacterium alkalinitrilicum]|uniref:EamA family transporter n=1 Tax=Alkalihalobacterium alkalinitrilicum TaxID=427920 RepID=UPI0011527431|nr:EamA family transporter [Alkalihalobacterium alkalinitrilicum]
MKLKYSLLVFIGACSYGILSTFVKLAYGQGFSHSEVIGSQFFIGWFLLLLLILFIHKQKMTRKNLFLLLAAGTTTSLTGIFYYLALETIPASLAIILLFQFTWIGVLIEAISEKKWPSKSKLISIGLIFIGTFLAAGPLLRLTEELTLIGVMYGLIAAFAFAWFIFLSGKVAISVNPILRSFLFVTGAMLFTLLVFPPSFLLSGALQNGLWIYALPLGFFGLVLPTILFAIGIPKIGTGLGTILSAAELPTAVVMSVLVLKEFVSLAQWAGVILILAAITYSQYQNLPLIRKKHEKTS